MARFGSFLVHGYTHKLFSNWVELFMILKLVVLKSWYRWYVIMYGFFDSVITRLFPVQFCISSPPPSSSQLQRHAGCCANYKKSPIQRLDGTHPDPHDPYNWDNIYHKEGICTFGLKEYVRCKFNTEVRFVGRPVRAHPCPCQGTPALRIICLRLWFLLEDWLKPPCPADHPICPLCQIHRIVAYSTR